MNRISERLFIGDANDGRDPEALVAAGIGSVLNATEVSDGWSQGTGWSQEAGDGLTYIRLNQPDGQPIPHEILRQAERFLMHEVVVLRRPLLIHCAAGISRASTFSIFWLMLAGFGWDEAEALVRAARPIIAPNAALKASVLAYLGRGTE